MYQHQYLSRNGLSSFGSSPAGIKAVLERSLVLSGPLLSAFFRVHFIQQSRIPQSAPKETGEASDRDGKLGAHTCFMYHFCCVVLSHF